MSGLPYWPISFQGKWKSSHFFIFIKYVCHFVYVCRFQSVYKIWDGVKLNIEMISVRVSMMRKLLGCAILPDIRFKQLIKKSKSSLLAKCRLQRKWRALQNKLQKSGRKYFSQTSAAKLKKSEYAHLRISRK